MNLHKIIDITEADFGCEEHLDGPHAVLIFEDGDKLEVSEQWIAEQDIKEGKYIWIRNDGCFLKAVRVVGAIIVAEKDGGADSEKILFATQRDYGDLKDGWEFPGGKIEEGETPEQAIVREIKEELDTVIKVEKYVDTIEYDYPEFHLSMDCFLCSIVEGDLVLKEHEDAMRLTKETLDSVDWLPADVTILDQVRELL
ncbi:8-oxo-dGTP diphosphatase [Lachnospiraceae bacterium NE2001]|nr:8-oxo-dGTP diphosphatase [Lachnospiraceae bacterium NE2001]